MYLRIRNIKSKGQEIMKKLLLFVFALTASNSFAASLDNYKTDLVTVTNVNNSIDDLIASYDKYVDRYIAVMKKVKAGDASAMTEYAKLLKQAQDLQAKIEKAKGQMTEAQLAKYVKVLNKMNKALQSM